METHWNDGMMRWAPYIDDKDRAYPLHHLHPLRYDLPIGNGQIVEIRVAFAMHCFTRSPTANDRPAQLYKDKRETRAFCPDRYSLSFQLPKIARALATRKCGYAKNENYITIDVQASGGNTAKYGVFFNVRRVKDTNGLAVLLTIQSAYALAQDKQLPIRGAIRFTRLIELTLEGIRPRPPKN